MVDSEHGLIAMNNNTIKVIREEAAKDGKTFSGWILDAIALYRYISEKRREGYMLLMDNGREVREVRSP